MVLRAVELDRSLLDPTPLYSVASHAHGSTESNFVFPDEYA
jgi:hypothetical protein